ncbi:DUF624 domain-containing protein [Enterococcus saccharolyticus]|uniref:YesL family protein n=1 Tax=Enterococcus saccharolyticus TaxID=41997 RepID=UPI001E37F3D5|nr:DUF624 domain-containing protein [Enterococcus saccharolyticus]MCD5002044.1 DUF624 domain-containing protein [Enterococcus saccharolyticus]
MVSSGVQRLFYVAWTMIKLNLFFIIGSIMGGFILGIGPSFQSMNDLLTTNGIDYQKMTWRAFFNLWKQNFKRANIHFWLFSVSFFVISYNLYLSTQLSGLIWLIIDFMLVFVLLLLSVLYIYVLLYETKYEISTLNLLKLAFISVFLQFSSFLKVLFVLASVLAITWYFKGLILFASFSLLMMFSGYVTKDIREIVDRKLGTNDSAYQTTI